MRFGRRKRYERTAHNLVFKTTRVASGGGDAITMTPIELLQDWFNDRPIWRVVSAQQVDHTYEGQSVHRVHYLVVMEREL